jgi:CheY-like chemotaxis protein
MWTRPRLGALRYLTRRRSPISVRSLTAEPSIVVREGPEDVKIAAIRVLIADDEPLVVETLRAVLTDEGFDVMAVTTGAAALAAVPRFVPDALLVDINMPGLSGPQVLEALRGTGSTIPVIAISGYVKGPMDGFFACLEKPIHYPLLLRTIASAVGRDA